MDDQLEPSPHSPDPCAQIAPETAASAPRMVVFLIVLSVVFSALRYTYSTFRVCLRQHEEQYFFDFNYFYFYASLARTGKPYWKREAIDEHAKQAHYRRCTNNPIYLPAVYLSFQPLTLLSVEEARVTWVLIEHASLLLALGLIVATLGLHKQPLALGVLGFLVFNYFPLRLNTWCGQTNNACLLMLALCFFLNKRGWQFLAGGALAIAALIKFTPAIIVGYFVWKRKVKVCLGFAVALALCIVIPMFIVGPDAQIQQAKNIFKHGKSNVYPGPPVHRAFGNSVARLLASPEGELTPTRLVFVKAAVAAFWIVVLGVAGWLTWPRASDHPLRQSFEYALAIGTPLMLSSIVEIHHCVWLLLPFAVMLTTPRSAQPRHFWLWLGAVYVLLGLEYWPDRFKALHYGPLSVMMMGKFVGIVGMWALVAAVLRRFPKAAVQDVIGSQNEANDSGNG